MQRIPSTMTAQELQAWRDHHAQSLTDGANALGLSRRQFADYLAGNYPVPLTIALLCTAYDWLSARRRRELMGLTRPYRDLEVTGKD